MSDAQFPSSPRPDGSEEYAANRRGGEDAIEINAVATIPADSTAGYERSGAYRDLIVFDRSNAETLGSGTPFSRARRGPLLNWLLPRAATIMIAACIGGLVGALISGGADDKAEVNVADTNEAEPPVALPAKANEIAPDREPVRATMQADRTTATVQPAPATATKPLRPAQPRKIAGFDPWKNTSVSREITGSVRSPQDQPVARDWTLWRVRNGRALVEARGAYYLVVPGSTLPRLGRVQRITRRDGRWIVQTPNGLIVQRG